MKTDPQLALRVLLLVVGGAFLYMILPFATPLLAAATISVLAWPLRERLRRALWGQELLAVAATFVLVTSGLLGVVALLVGLVLPELGLLVGELSAMVQSDALERATASLRLPALERALSELLGEPVDLGGATGSAARQALGAATSGVAQVLPAILNVTGRAVLSTLIFAVALASFLAQGPQALEWVRRLSPLHRAQTDELLAICASFARNVVLAGAVAGLSQGLVAAIGYSLAGVERVLLLGTLTAVVAYVPFVGTTLVWVPLALLNLVQGRPGAAAFIVFWSLALTGTVDNLLKPWLVRGNSHLHPLLVFLGVFGGLVWFGLIGLLVGPVLAAIAMALLTMVEESRRTP